MIHTVEVTKHIVRESENKIEPDDALDMFRASHIYKCLMDDDVGLYGESSLYIFSLFKEEHVKAGGSYFSEIGRASCRERVFQPV
jgi:hypothetical protein